MVITIRPATNNADPNLKTIEVLILSIGDGPFLLVEYTDYSVAVVHVDQNVIIDLKITNVGNEDANLV